LDAAFKRMLLPGSGRNLPVCLSIFILVRSLFHFSHLPGKPILKERVFWFLRCPAQTIYPVVSLLSLDLWIWIWAFSEKENGPLVGLDSFKDWILLKLDNLRFPLLYPTVPPFVERIPPFVGERFLSPLRKPPIPKGVALIGPRL